jgi:hypothetical protein
MNVSLAEIHILLLSFWFPAVNGLGRFPVLVATGLRGLDFAAGQRRSFKDPLEPKSGLVVRLLGQAFAGPFESGVVFFSWAHR